MKLLVIGLIVIVVISLIVFFYFVPITILINAKMAGVDISLEHFYRMRLKKVPASLIVSAMIEAHKAKLPNIKIEDLEAHYLDGGSVERVVHAMTIASNANVNLSFEKAKTIDLSGRNVLEEVRTYIKQK